MSGEMPFDPSIAGVKQTPHDAKDAKKEKTPEERLESLKEANSLALDVPFDAILKIKKQIENKLTESGFPENYSLAYRKTPEGKGEAHITLIRPTDAKILREGLVTPEDLKTFDECIGQPVEIAGIGTIPPNLDAEAIKAYTDDEAKQAAANPKFKPKGVTFFAVLKLPNGVQEKLNVLIDLLNSTQPDPEKQLAKVNPHVTIGFTLKDRFDGSKAEVNPTFEKPGLEIQYESLVAQKPIKDAEGEFVKGPDGNQVSKYEAV